MIPMFSARIPYNIPNLMGARYGPDVLTRRRKSLPVVNHRNDPLGKVLRLEPDAHGVRVIVDLGARDAKHIVDRHGSGYFLEPISVRDQLIGFRLGAIETWPAAELTRTGASVFPARPRPAQSPIGPRPAVNLTPDLGPHRFMH